jgi:hypothetical protein
MNVNKTVFDYATILASLQQIAPEAHIAGGAVRDTVLNKPIHDIDIFADDGHAEEVAARLRSSHAYVKVGEWKEYLGFSDPAMLRVAKFEKADETIPICVIGLKSRYTAPRENIARFDFGICMAAFDGGKTILTTEEFNRDVAQSTFTLRRADSIQQFAYSKTRFEKITAGRYSGWTLAIPKVFERLAEKYAFDRKFYWSDSVKGFLPRDILKPKERLGVNAAQLRVV